MANLIDIASVPVVDVWGEAVQARRIEGEQVMFALIELAPDAVVPGHQHANEQLGMVITGELIFTVGDETRTLGPGGTWRVPSNVPHQVSVGPAGAVVIDVFAPNRTDWATLPSHPPSPPDWPDRH
jgi:quercetin dioxygenase-like cupin family protein